MKKLLALLSLTTSQLFAASVGYWQIPLNLNASQLTSGTVPTNVLPGALGTLSTWNGGELTNVIFLSASPTVRDAYATTLAANTNSVRVSGPSTLNSNLVLTANSTSYLCYARRHRIKNTGLVTGFDLTSCYASNTFAYKIKIIRPNYNDSSFSVVSDTGWLTNTFTHNKTNVVELATPIACLEGDIPAYYHEGSQLIGAITSSGDTVAYIAGDATGTVAITGFITNYALGLRVRARSPQIAFTGDSIMAGSNNGTNWVPQMATGVYGEIRHTIPYQLYSTVNFNYGNFARPSQNLAWVHTNALASITNALSSALWIHCGINDIVDGRPWTDVVTNLDGIRALWPTNYPLYMSEILPYTDGDDADALTIRTFNTNINAWASSNGIVVAKLHDVFGKIRVSTGELDDLKTEYDYDGLHLTLAGVQKYASLVVPFISTNTGAVTSPGLVLKPYGPYAPEAMQTTGAHLWTDGTNLCVILQSIDGARTTNKLSMTTWP